MFFGSRFVAHHLWLASTNQAVFDLYRNAGRPIVIVAWHGFAVVHLAVFHQLFGTSARGVLMPVDTPRGWALQRFAERYDLQVVPLGEDAKTKAKTVVKLMHLLRQGHIGLLAADGPLGPAGEVKDAVVRVAQRTGAVIIPSSVVTSRGWKMQRRWDEHLVPLPGSRVLFHFGVPIDTRSEDGVAPSTADLQQRLALALESGGREAEVLFRNAQFGHRSFRSNPLLAERPQFDTR